tara:strand:- start:217 stop:519 length:303 start_codon:yes stop_codon:yes gene_type:complete
MTEENEDKKICPCGGTNCDGGYGWKWKSSDLGNRHYVGGQSYKAGQLWVEICGAWTGDEAPPDPPGITNIQRYMIEAKTDSNAVVDATSKQTRFHNQRRV